MTKPVNIWFPTYIGDFFTATASMTGHEVGAYQIIIATLWKAGGAIPADDRQLAKLVKATPRQWKEIRESIWPLFEIKGGQLMHESTSAEIAKAVAMAEKNAANAKARWDRERNANAMRPHSEGNASAMLRACEGEGEGPYQGKSSLGESYTAREDVNPFGVIQGGK